MLDRSEFRTAYPDLRALRLDLDLAKRVRGIGSVIDDLSIHDVPDGVAIADDFGAVPLTRGLFQVLLAAESDFILPLGITSIPVEASAVTSDPLATFLPVELIVWALS